MKVLSSILPAATLLAIAAAPAVASADYGYVCSTYHTPGDTSLGDEGYTGATYYSGPNCTGSYQGSKNYCSPGRLSFSSVCASSASYLYPRADLLALYEMLQRAAEWGQRVYWSTTTCASGGSTCGASVTFYGN